MDEGGIGKKAVERGVSRNGPKMWTAFFKNVFWSLLSRRKIIVLLKTSCLISGIADDMSV
jgi:hypothetical protein